MNSTCTVLKSGNSAAVVLPAEWRRRFGVKAGDVLRVSASTDGEITFSVPRRKSRVESVDSLLGTLEGLPDIPWVGGDSPEDDRELLGRRYA